MVQTRIPILLMKTTLDVPDALFQRAKRTALERGISLKALVVEALEKSLGPETDDMPPMTWRMYPPEDEELDYVYSGDEVLKAIKQIRYGEPVTPLKRYPRPGRRKLADPEAVEGADNPVIDRQDDEEHGS